MVQSKNHINIFKISVLLLVSLFSFSLISGCSTDDTNQLEHEVITEMLSNYDSCYITGHKNPDTDTVCSSILCSHLYKKAYGFDAKPVVSGKLNNETKFVLNKFGVDIPDEMEDAFAENFILVDHTNVNQLMDDIDLSNVIAIYDHHALGDIETISPLVNVSMPIGATGSIMYLQFKKENIQITQQEAGMIISCILSDTSNLSNSSTTDADKRIINELKPIAKIDDIDQYYQEMLKELVNYDGMSVEDIFLSGVKEYSTGEWSYCISCLSAYGEKDTKELIDVMKKYIAQYGEASPCQHVYVMACDVENNTTDLFGWGPNVEEIMNKLYGTTEPHFDQILSRKSDVLPKIKEHYDSL